MSVILMGCTPRTPVSVEPPVSESPEPPAQEPVADPAPVDEPQTSLFIETVAGRTDLKEVAFSFTYLTHEGRLMKATFSDGSELQLIDKVGGAHFGYSDDEYEVHPAKPLIAYLRGDEAFLYNYELNKTQSLYEGDAVSMVRWSPLGGYLLIDDGTDVRRSNSFYRVSDGSMFSMGITGTAYWSPDEQYLAIGVAEPVSPGLPIHDGASTSTVIVRASDPDAPRILAQGDHELFCTPWGWLSNTEVVVSFWHWEEGTQVLYTIDLVTEEKNPYTASPEEASNTLFRHVSSAQPVSADGKYRLYSEEGKVILWVRDSDERIVIAAGHTPKWWP